MIVGIVLSAGESKRMGTPKQLLPWGETTMLQHVIENAGVSKLSQVLVVLGHRADEIAGAITASSRTRLLVNHDFRTGMISSIQCGIRNAPADAEAFMILLGDQPFIGPDVIDGLIDICRVRKYGIVIPVYDGRRGHPVILDLRYGEELLSLRDQSAREVIRRHSRDVFEVPMDSPNVLADIDTPQDYRDAMQRAGRET